MIVAENLVKIYKTKELEVLALQGLDLVVEDGELMAIVGNSGSGKSTLMNMLGALDKPSAGRLEVDGKDLLKMTDAKATIYKRETVGFVWQNNARNLIPYLTARENIEMPMLMHNSARRRERANRLLDLVGLSHRGRSKLSQLSGGEQQRVAIAIALANRPRLLLADEPTGAVDTRTAEMILDVFRDINREMGVTIVIVTHDAQISRQVDRVVAIRDGRTSSEYIKKRSYREEIEEMERELRDHRSDQAEETHVELAVVDAAGRMQIPRELLDSMGVQGKSKLLVEEENGKIVISKPGE